MDYGFAPGRTKQDKQVKELFRRRNNCLLIDQKKLGSLQAFVAHLGEISSTDGPVENVLVGAHASGEGHIFMPMYPRQKGSTDFEVLVTTLEQPPLSIAIPDSVFGQAPGDPPSHYVHFKGCNIGQSETYLEKFKEALGDHVLVTAPKHFHGLSYSGPQLFEFMAYEFKINSPTALKTRTELLNAFNSAGFQYIGAPALPVPPEDFERWLPTKTNELLKGKKTPEYPKLPVAVGELETFPTLREFRVESGAKLSLKRRLVYEAPVPPTDQATLLADLRRAFDEEDQEDEFPVYERLGLESVDELMTTFTWKFTRIKKTSKVSVIGTRFRYTLTIPITHRDAPESVYVNHHPKTGSADPANFEIRESDEKFFLEV
jgi:hypothetical protein